MPTLSGSLDLSGSFSSTGSFSVTGSITNNGNPVITSNQTGSFATTGSNTFSGSVVITGSLTVSGSNTFINIGPAQFTGSVTSTGGFTGSLLGTAANATSASYALNATSASYAANATSASYALNATSASNSVTSSYIDPTFISASAAASGFGSGGGSINTSSLATTGSNSFNGNQIVTGSVTSTLGFTGSLLGTASYVDPSFAFNGGTIDASIYFSPNNTNADQSLVFTNVTDTVNGGYGYPNWSDDFTLTYNPQTNELKLTGSLIVKATGEVVIIKDLPTTEPTASGQLWISGSTGSNSRFLCVRD